MSWSECHQKSEQLAAEAQILTQKEPTRALKLYAEAAKAEASALMDIDAAKKRTVGVTAVSAVALWFKAKEFAEAQNLAYRMLSLGTPGVPLKVTTPA